MIYLQITLGDSMRPWAPGYGIVVEAHSGVGPRVPCTGLHRVSPLFPLLNSQSTPDFGDGKLTVDFLVYREPFRVLGRLFRTHAAHEGLTVWFGIGLASVVLVRKEKSAYPAAIDEFAANLLIGEHWEVREGALHSVSYSGSRSSELAPDIKVPNLLAEGDEPTAVFEEFFLSLGLALRRASTYTPSELTVLRGFEDEVRDLMEQVVFIGSDRGTRQPPDSLQDYDLSDGIVREQLYQQAIDKVVQINSSLSYVISQAYRGAPPLLQSAPLIQRHSLLGVGRAHRALVNMVRDIERALHSMSVRESIGRAWGAWPPLDGFGKGQSPIDTSTWKTLRLPDVLLHNTPDEDQHKLTYFSGRLGFRESEYAVAAAIQALAGGDSPHWHLSTMTHEVLHGHVREILNAVFGPVREDGPRGVKELWQLIFSRFRQQMRDGCGDEWKLIDSARNVFLHYVCLTTQMGSLTRPPRPRERMDGVDVIGMLAVPRQDEVLLAAFELENRSVAEIMVHVLDLYYFFDDDPARYLSAIWRSWESVPSVMRDTRQYVLRSLLACTSLDEGDPIDRFVRATRRCLEAFGRIGEEHGAYPVVERAEALLDRELATDDGTDKRERGASHSLFQPFYAALAVVDLTRHCIASEHVKDELFGSDVDAADDPESGVVFPAVGGEFADRSVESAAEFASWRARQSRTEDKSRTERNAAWLFIACGRIHD
jgi:hypothetical protein